MRVWWLLVLVPLTACGVETGDTPAPYGSIGDVVPWQALPPTDPELPTITIAASPDPAPAAAATPCRPSDVRVEATREGVAGGTVGLTVTLAAVGGTPCRVSGVPEVTADDSGTSTFAWAARDDTSYDGPVLVTADSPAVLWLTWESEPFCAAPVTNHVVAIGVGDGTVEVRGFGGVPGCADQGGVDPAVILGVHPWAPESWNPQETITSVEDVDVEGELNLHGLAGSTLEFEVTLTSQTSLVLDPCPDYRIEMYGPPDPEIETWSLNCAAVPYRTPDGRPYLPEQTPVTFAMQTTVPATGSSKFLWHLVGSDRGTGGVLQVD